MNTRLRPLTPADLDAVFHMMAEPDGVAMAAFTAEDPTDRAAFDAHMERLFANPACALWAILDADDELVGTISTFPADNGEREVTYWITQQSWGRGHASRSLELVLDQTPRPVLARVASDNVRSRRVLEGRGFQVVATDRDYATGRGAETDELVLQLS